MENAAVVHCCNDSVNISSVFQEMSSLLGSLGWKAACNVNLLVPGLLSGVHLVEDEHFME